ncbi:MAG: tetratricopeptide repeat protein [Deltaproteobacteria bacterium]|nr:tetratricopeptide repeat protein [Deltaproteobacteria bacterium]
MRRRVLILSLILSCVVVFGIAGLHWQRSNEAETLSLAALARLDAPLAEAPEIDRIHAGDARSKLERAMQLGRDDRRTRGLFHYATALERVQAGDLVFAEDELGVARDFLGDTARVHALAGEIARRKSDLLTARVEADAALALEPHDVRALMLLADLTLDGDEPEQALAALDALAELAPEVSVVLNRRGLALERLERFGDAEASFLLATQKDRLNHNAWINLGRRLRGRGSIEEARAAFLEALEVAPGDPDAWFGRGLTDRDLGRVAEAQQAFARAAELAPNDAEPLLALGDLALSAHDTDRAIAAYRRALAHEDADAGSWLKLGNALFGASDLVGAEQAYRQALRRSPTLSAARNGLGATLMYRGDLEQAAEAFARAAELDARDPNPLLNLALLARRRGDAAAERDAYRRVLNRDPNNAIALARL